MNTHHEKTPGEATILAAIRRFILLVFLLGVTGAGAELLLLEHMESLWQWVPLLLILLSFVALGCLAASRRTATVRFFQITMLLFMISGVVGIILHYQGKVEFKLEVNPDLGGWELFWAAVKGAAVPPVLAPGVMIQLGLLGLAYTYRHSVLRPSNEKNYLSNNGG
ncbi:MAG: hypothetical protein ACREAB_08115 [Blastocatellia bacterium]